MLTQVIDQNLYVGTSASELLHFVNIPPEPLDLVGSPSYILASRLLPPFYENLKPSCPGVQQILLLPSVNKACILCNWTVTFYSLPELSPVFGNTQIRPCNWIGGVDLNKSSKVDPQETKPSSVTVLVSLNKKIRVIKISETPRALKTIDFPGSVISVRRDSYACVADEKSYALLDIDRLLKIPLFPISSLNHLPVNNIQTEQISGDILSKSVRGALSSKSSTSISSKNQGHDRCSSLGAATDINSKDNISPKASVENFSGETSGESLGQDSFDPAVKNINSSQTQISSSSKPLPLPPSELRENNTLLQSLQPHLDLLRPHIVSPTPQEFFLVTGTSRYDPGVGMFVNLDGDPTRSTLEFDQYPHEIVVDGRGVGVEPTSTTIEEEEEGFLLASMTPNDSELSHRIEIQRWDLDRGDANNKKHWLHIPNTPARSTNSTSIGLRMVLDPGEVYFGEVIGKLNMRRFQPINSRLIMDNSSTCSTRNSVCHTTKSPGLASVNESNFAKDNDLIGNWEDQRSEEERQFARQLGLVRSRIIVWSGNNIWWAVRNPLVIRLDASLPEATANSQQDDNFCPSLYRQQLIDMIRYLRGREANKETDYLSFAYLKQRAGLLLFLHDLDIMTDQLSDYEYQVMEDALIEGGLDPRVIISLIPYLREDIDEGKSGIWIHDGIKNIAEKFIIYSIREDKMTYEKALVSDRTLISLRKYLTAWRKKRTFGNIASNDEMFRSVDFALLVVLLRLDRLTPAGLPRPSSTRSDLYDLVDHGIDFFEKAVTLLESEHRLYVLSRLYQSRKMASKVLGTWRRIIEGELDKGGEFTEGEQKVQEYLSKIRNASLIQKYGVWLATRNPKLGAQVFAEDRSEVKFEPHQVLGILRDEAPVAVKYYLEYLVFHKNHTEYVNELIFYYLDIVIKKLEESEDTRSILMQSYESYRALRPPKPTYHQFISENSTDEEWWHCRLRLLGLLGSGQASLAYDSTTIFSRIVPFTSELVPELIILDGLQANHDKALKLLTHSLGDYDTAINYCLLGGSSIYHPISGTLTRHSEPTRDQQTKLFGVLLLEVLNIEDVSNCVEQTSNLLERFGDWFDVEQVLKVIPDTWSVGLVSGFLLNAFRQTLKEKNETMVTKALSGAENLKANLELIGKISAAGMSIQS